MSGAIFFAQTPASQALPRSHVIRRRGIFEAVRNRGRRLTNRWLALNVLPLGPANTGLAQVAFLTPKRLGPAVIRNRVRRRMREVYRRYVGPPPVAFYFVWIARPPMVELDFEKIKQCMQDLKARALIES